MAQSRITPADVFRMHADEARSNMLSAATDEARTHYDHAAAHHDTAARLLAHAARSAGNEAMYRSLASAARSRREAGIAAAYDAQADAAHEASLFAPASAERFHEMGLARSADARAADAPPPDEEAVVGTDAPRSRRAAPAAAVAE